MTPFKRFFKFFYAPDFLGAVVVVNIWSFAKIRPAKSRDCTETGGDNSATKTTRQPLLSAGTEAVTGTVTCLNHCTAGAHISDG